MSNFDKHVLAFFPHPYTLRANSTIQRLQSIRKIINFWYTFGWKWWVISFRDYLGLSDACSDDVIGWADRFGFQNFCSPVPVDEKKISQFENFENSDEFFKNNLWKLTIFLTYLDPE